MAAPKLTDGDFMRLFTELGSAERSRRIGQTVRRILDRRRTLEHRYKRRLVSPVKAHSPQPEYVEHPGRIQVDLKDGFVLIGSDAHYWPGPPSLMHRAFIKLCKELRPKIVILNGDVVDLASISRHPPI